MQQRESRIELGKIIWRAYTINILYKCCLCANLVWGDISYHWRSAFDLTIPVTDKGFREGEDLEIWTGWRNLCNTSTPNPAPAERKRVQSVSISSGHDKRELDFKRLYTNLCWTAGTIRKSLPDAIPSNPKPCLHTIHTKRKAERPSESRATATIMLPFECVMQENRVVEYK